MCDCEIQLQSQSQVFRCHVRPRLPCSPSPLLRSGTSLQPLPHPQCGVIVSWRSVCRCQRVLQVPLQRHPQRGHTLCVCRSETSKSRMRVHPNDCFHYSPEYKEWWGENSDPLLMEKYKCHTVKMQRWTYVLKAVSRKFHFVDSCGQKMMMVKRS